MLPSLHTASSIPMEEMTTPETQLEIFMLDFLRIITDD
jgi:hypothetical protein